MHYNEEFIFFGPMSRVVKMGSPGIKPFGPIVFQPICLTGQFDYELRFKYIEPV